MTAARRLVAACLLALPLAIGQTATAAEPTKETLRAGRAAAKVCLACHHFKREKRKFGPHLVKLLDRPVATAANYQYSEALKGLGGVWSEDRLASWLNDPAGYAPGSTMKFDGYKDMEKSRAVVAYIKERYNK